MLFTLKWCVHPPYLTDYLSLQLHLRRSASFPQTVDGVPWNNSLLAAHCRALRFWEALALFRSMLSLSRTDAHSLSLAAKAAAGLHCLPLAASLHSLAVKITLDPVLSNSLVSMYLRCGRPRDARKVFDDMPHRTLVSWNALVAGLAASRDESVRDQAWELLGPMREEGLRMDRFTLCALLPLCRVARGRAIHGFAVRNWMCSSFSSGSDCCYVDGCLIAMYCRCGHTHAARWVFDSMGGRRNVVIWTSMIQGHAENGELDEALLLFREMQVDDGGIRPNRITLVTITSVIGSFANNSLVKEVHGFTVRRSELDRETSLMNSLIDSYFKCGDLSSARRLFNDGSWEKDAISWSTMVFGYGIHGQGEESVVLFRKMCESGVNLNPITCVGVISACGRSGLVSRGVEIYATLVEKYKVVPTTEICSAMVDMFCRSGRLDQALQFINTMPVKPAAPTIWGPVFASAAAAEGNCEFLDLACELLDQSEWNTSSNHVSMSNSLASSGRWETVAQVRTRMKRQGLKKLPGYSWICMDGLIHTFFVADKWHQCAAQIYHVLDSINLTMKGEDLAS